MSRRRAVGAGIRKANLLDAPIVAVVPVGRCHSPQPVRGGHGERVKRGPQRLGQQLDPVQVAHSGKHVRAVGALPATHLEQLILTRRVQHAGRQALSGAAVQHPGAELAQHAVVEARVAPPEPSSLRPGTIEPGAGPS